MKLVRNRIHGVLSFAAVAASMSMLQACAAGGSDGLEGSVAQSIGTAQSQVSITNLINDANNQQVLATAVSNPNCAADANAFASMAIPFLPGTMNANNLYDPNGMFSPHGFFGSQGFGGNRPFDANSQDANVTARDSNGRTGDGNRTAGDGNYAGHFPMPAGVDPNSARPNFPGVDPNSLFGNMGVDGNNLVIPGFDPNHMMDPNFSADPNAWFGNFNNTFGHLCGCAGQAQHAGGNTGGGSTGGTTGSAGGTTGGTTGSTTGNASGNNAVNQ